MFCLWVVCATLLGLVAGGLGPATTFLAFSIALLAAIFSYFETYDPGMERPASPRRRYSSLLFWFVAGCFTLFAVRSFCWLLFVDGAELRIQSVNNLGDLALHVTYIKTFANGVPLWPDNPIYVFSKLRYPAGVDLFNGLLTIFNVNLIRGLVWIGLLASLATFYALYRWGGLFTVAGFLFNGGVVGFAALNHFNFEFKDYQGVSNIAWKSIPLSMFVTQRGLLYAIPAALLLLWHWREMFYRMPAAAAANAAAENTGAMPASDTVDFGVSSPRSNGVPQPAAYWHFGLQRGPLPFWIELAIYCTLPLFHVHTFLAMSVVLAFLFLLGDTAMRIRTATLVGAALAPATFLVWLITDHFHAKSMLKWQPGWVQSIGDFAHPLGSDRAVIGAGFLRRLDQVLEFWLLNFGFMLPLAIAGIVLLVVRAWRNRTTGDSPMSIPVVILPTVAAMLLLALLAPFLKSWWYLLILPALAIPGTLLLRTKAKGERLAMNGPLVFATAAIAIFLFGYLFKTAPWEWDNLKLMFWGYFLVLPYLWKYLIANWAWPLRVVICLALFWSGFVSLFGGLKTPGYGFANRKELAEVGVAIRDLPKDARFAAFPTYNHPLLLHGRKCVLGYPGHLWTQGFDKYHEQESKLQRLMRGEPDWREAAKALDVRYIFWGREEQLNYPNSKRPWEQSLATATKPLPSATIYDLEKSIAQP